LEVPKLADPIRISQGGLGQVTIRRQRLPKPGQHTDGLKGAFG
jgi:hypothetical protein